MTNHVVRLYVLAAALLVFFVLCIVIAAHPWLAESKTTVRDRDPREAALAAREKRLKHQALLVGRITKRRWAVYGVRLQRRQAEIKAARREYESQLAAAQAAREQIARVQALAAARAEAARRLANAQTALASSTVTLRSPRAAAPSHSTRGRPAPVVKAAPRPSAGQTSTQAPRAPAPAPEASPPPPPPPEVVQDPPKTKSSSSKSH